MLLHARRLVSGWASALDGGIAGLTPERASVPAPGLRLGPRPEREVGRLRPIERANRWLRGWLDGCLHHAPGWTARGDRQWVAQVRREAAAARGGDLHALALRVRQGLLNPAAQASAWPAAVGLAVEATRRRTQLDAFDTQLIAVRAVLHQQLAEMATGEGKTLAVGLAACAAALAGVPIHVITANDYLVQRDAERLKPIAQALGLRVGWVVQADPPGERPARYGCDITFVTAKELVFDYLRDGLAPPGGERNLRGLCQAIVDEADAVLIDEARVPLILSAAAPDTELHAHANEALEFARGLREGQHFRLDRAGMRASLTALGRRQLASATQLAQASVSTSWRHPMHREHSVVMALAALHLFQQGRHYLVDEDKLVLVDENTGRVAEGRAWSQGLQQLVEAKEGLAPTPPTQTLAQLTYQRFFPRYLRLGGLSGTLSEARAELMATYNVTVRRVPLRKPSRLIHGPHRLFRDHAVLHQAVAERAREMAAQGRPMLVAMDTVAQADALAEALREQGLLPAVLHARNDATEAQTVAQAGVAGALTVTTNVAGRGTDILLGEGVAQRGGLHVLCCQLNAARRIDRQLAGRAGRQGEPGSSETWWSLQTPVLAAGLAAWPRRSLARFAHRLPSGLVWAMGRWLQWQLERRDQEVRRRLVAFDEQQHRRLGFVGAAE